MGIEFLSATPEFNDVTTTVSIEGIETRSTTDIDQRMDVFNITLGLKFFLFN